MLKYFCHKIYDNLLKPVIGLDVDLVEYIDTISAEILKIKENKEFESVDILQL